MPERRRTIVVSGFSHHCATAELLGSHRIVALGMGTEVYRTRVFGLNLDDYLFTTPRAPRWMTEIC